MIMGAIPGLLMVRPGVKAGFAQERRQTELEI
jgi:hypothetical protein